MSEEKVWCDRCDKEGAEKYRQDTKYVDEERNWVTLCPECREENDEYWVGMWSDYYASCL